MARSLQLSLPGLSRGKLAHQHGGDLRRGKRKTARPFDRKQALHVVLRSSKAHGRWSMLSPCHSRPIHDLTHELARKRGVRLFRFANVGNHIHLLIQAPSRAVFQAFLRELAGTLAIVVTGAKKGNSLNSNESGRGFWDHLAFTRIVSFGRDFENVMRYLVKNLFEAMGVPMKKLLARGIRVISVNGEGRVSGLPG